MALDLEQCCQLVDQEITRLAEVADGADPATPVPTCGDWELADLLQHAGEVFRWAATMVRDSSQDRLRREELAWDLPVDPSGFPDWIRAGTPFVLEQFRACDPATPMWAWGWPKAAGFWPRRMVHEIGVHRADAELALGIAPAFDAEVAADGVDELLDNLPHAAYFAPGVAELRGEGEALAFVTPDADWLVELLPDRFVWRRAAGPADAAATVRAEAADLYLGLWGRPATIEVVGDTPLWERWLRCSAL